ncbi:MAG: GWxTD domain-containing protein [bacterium]
MFPSISLYSFLFTLIFTQSIQIFPKSNVQNNYYEHGVQLREVGDWEQALKVWWEGRNALEREDLTDPRIGIAFIELATEMKAEKYYGTASDMYFWGFSHDNISEYTEVIEQEYSRIALWLEDDDRENWRLSLEKGDVSTVANKIKQFWLARDPSPATEGNERLLLHWERIAFARKNFKKNNNTIYGTDDRGLIYVTYGKPTKKKWGHFGTIETVKYKPEYEVWKYDTLDPEVSLVFIFGKNGKTGSYGIRHTLEEFIPNSVYETGFSHVLQITLMYCSELAAFDPVFEDLFKQLVEIASLIEDLEESKIQKREMERELALEYNDVMREFKIEAQTKQTAGRGGSLKGKDKLKKQ